MAGLAWIASAWANPPGVCDPGFLLDGAGCVRWVALGEAPEPIDRVVVDRTGITLLGPAGAWQRSIGGDWVRATHDRRPRRRPPRGAGPDALENPVRVRSRAEQWALEAHEVWREAGGVWVRSVPSPIRASQAGAGRGLLVVVGDGQVWALEQRPSPWLGAPLPRAAWPELERAARPTD